MYSPQDIAKSIENSLKKYDVTNDYNANYSFDTPNKQTNNNTWDNFYSNLYKQAPTIDEHRSLLDRVGDVLSVGQYATMGVLNGIVNNIKGNGDFGAVEGFFGGLRAANPFGKGYTKGEHSFSHVIGDLGWKPTTTAGRIAKMTLGLAGDIFLDPTTYMSGGLTALFRGSGEAGLKLFKSTEVANKLSEFEKMGYKVTDKYMDDLPQQAYNMAKDRLSKTNDLLSPDEIEHMAKKEMESMTAHLSDMHAFTMDNAMQYARKIADDLTERGHVVSEEQIVADAEQYFRKYNQLAGVKADRGITFSLANAPFGKKIFRGLADKSFTIATPEAYKKLGDATLAPAMAKVRDAFYGSKIGNMLSTNSVLYKLGKENPEELFRTVKFVDSIKSQNLDRVAEEMKIREIGQSLNFSPAQQKELLTLLEDKKLWGKISALNKFAKTQEAQQIRRDMEDSKNAAQQELDDLLAQHGELKNQNAKAEQNVGTFKEEISKKQQRLSELNDLIGKQIDNETEVAALTAERDALQSNVDELISKLDDPAYKELLTRTQSSEQELFNRLTDLTNQKNLTVDELRANRQKIMDLIGTKTTKEEVVNFGEVPMSSAQKAYEIIQQSNMLQNFTGEELLKNQELLVGNLNKFLFNNNDVIDVKYLGRGVSSLISKLKDAYKNKAFLDVSASKAFFDELRSEVLSKPHLFTERGREIQGFVRRNITNVNENLFSTWGRSNGKSGFKSYEEYYTNRYNLIKQLFNGFASKDGKTNIPSFKEYTDRVVKNSRNTSVFNNTVKEGKLEQTLFNDYLNTYYKNDLKSFKNVLRTNLNYDEIVKLRNELDAFTNNEHAFISFFYTNPDAMKNYDKLHQQRMDYEDNIRIKDMFGLGDEVDRSKFIDDVNHERNVNAETPNQVNTKISGIQKEINYIQNNLFDDIKSLQNDGKIDAFPAETKYGLTNGNIWDEVGKSDIVAVTTNSSLRNNGSGIMGRGVAKQALDKYGNQIEVNLGEHLKQNGNVPGEIMKDGKTNIFSLPTKFDFKNKSDIALIENSLKEFVNQANKTNAKRIALVVPGIGNGGLEFKQVKELLDKYLDDRFVVYGSSLNLGSRSGVKLKYNQYSDLIGKSDEEIKSFIEQKTKELQDEIAGTKQYANSVANQRSGFPGTTTEEILYRLGGEFHYQLRNQVNLELQSYQNIIKKYNKIDEQLASGNVSTEGIVDLNKQKENLIEELKKKGFTGNPNQEEFKAFMNEQSNNMQDIRFGNPDTQADNFISSMKDNTKEINYRIGALNKSNFDSFKEYAYIGKLKDKGKIEDAVNKELNKLRTQKNEILSITPVRFKDKDLLQRIKDISPDEELQLKYAQNYVNTTLKNEFGGKSFDELTPSQKDYLISKSVEESLFASSSKLKSNPALESNMINSQKRLDSIDKLEEKYLKEKDLTPEETLNNANKEQIFVNQGDFVQFIKTVDGVVSGAPVNTRLAGGQVNRIFEENGVLKYELTDYKGKPYTIDFNQVVKTFKEQDRATSNFMTSQNRLYTSEVETTLTDVQPQLDEIDSQINQINKDFNKRKRQIEYTFNKRKNNNPRMLREQLTKLEEERGVQIAKLEESKQQLSNVDSKIAELTDAQNSASKLLNSRKTGEAIRRTTQAIQDSKSAFDEQISYLENTNTSLFESQKQIDALTDKINNYNNLLNNDDAFENYVKFQNGEDFIRRANDNMMSESTVYEELLNNETTLDEKTKNIIGILKSSLYKIGLSEVEIGKLSRGQFDNMFATYITHMATQEFVDLKRAIEANPEKGTNVTFDNIGFGSKGFNANNIQRQVKSIVLDGETIDDPSIVQINEFFKEQLKGKNAFSENIADLYVKRAMNNLDLLYDDKYMRTMMDVFGNDVFDHGGSGGFEFALNHIKDNGTKFEQFYNQSKEQLDLLWQGVTKENYQDTLAESNRIREEVQGFAKNIHKTALDAVDNMFIADTKDGFQYAVNAGMMREMLRAHAGIKTSVEMTRNTIKETNMARGLAQSLVNRMGDENFYIALMQTSGRVLDGMPIDEALKGATSFMRTNQAEAIGREVQNYINHYGADTINSYLHNPQEDFAKILEQKHMDNYRKSFTPEIKKGMTTKYADDALAKLGYSAESLNENITPIFNLTKEQVQAFKEIMADTIAPNFDETFKMIDGSNGQDKFFVSTFLNHMKKVSENIQNLDVSKNIKSVNEAISMKANQARIAQIMKDKSRFLMAYDKVTSIMKLNMTVVNPAFHMRNLYSNYFQTYLSLGASALNPKFQAQVIKAIMSKGRLSSDAVIEAIGKDGVAREVHWGDILAHAKAHGVLGKDYYTEEASQLMDGTSGLFSNNRFFGGKFAKLDPTNTTNFAPYKMGAALGSKFEDFSRLLHFAAAVKQGQTWSEAAETVNKFMIDYSDLTPFEQNTLRRIIPFYTWMKKNTALQIDTLLNRPGRYQLYFKGINAIEGTNDDDNARVNKSLLPNYLRDYVQTPFRVKKGFKGEFNTVFWNTAMPVNDLNKLDIFNPKDVAQDLFGSLSPIVKAPIEQAMNYNAFFEQQIVKDGENTVSARGQHLLSQIATTNLVKGFTNKEGTDLGYNVLDKLTGIKFAQVNQDFYKEQAGLVTPGKPGRKSKQQELLDYYSKLYNGGEVNN